MKVQFFTLWNNCWVRYINKYFQDKSEYDINWEIGNQWKVHKPLVYDVAVSMWANEYAMELSKMRIKYADRLVVVVRSYEIFFGHLSKIDWRNVDDVVFVNKAFYDEFAPQLLKAGCTRAHYMPNCIDLEEWKQQEHKPGFDIGWVASLSHKKGLDLIPQFVGKLAQKDKRYKLHLAGDADQIESQRHLAYVDNALRKMGCRDNVTFHGHVSNIRDFLKDKSYLFTCSVTEGHPNNVIEAMSLGIKPIIHGWKGAEYNFPEELIWYDIDRAVELVTEDKYDSDEYRRYSEDNFDLHKVYPQLEKILKGESYE